MSNRAIALIAEDDTDCEALRKIIHRILGDRVTIKKWAAHGGGTLKKKLAAQLNVLAKKGCEVFIIVHDLDRNLQNNALNNETQLRQKLDRLSSKVAVSDKHICIPIEELEAWFWSDPEVVQYVGRGKGNASKNPHNIEKPKEKLIQLSVGENRKPRYSTNMNPELAAKLNLELCAERCPAFQHLLHFLNSLQPPASDD